MQILAVGAMAVGPSTSALTLEERAGQHLAEHAEAADEPAAGFELRVAGHVSI
jgi:hypothetical protein